MRGAASGSGGARSTIGRPWREERRRVAASGFMQCQAAWVMGAASTARCGVPARRHGGTGAAGHLGERKQAWWHAAPASAARRGGGLPRMEPVGSFLIFFIWFLGSGVHPGL